jgi:hypothetical protein
VLYTINIHIYPTISLLKERRIMFTGSKLSQLSSCVFGLSKLLYPFNWFFSDSRIWFWKIILGKACLFPYCQRTWQTCLC